METILIHSDFILLAQLLKWANLVSTGGEAKDLIQDGEVLLNGVIETRRGKKVFPNDIIEIDGTSYKILKEEK